MFKDFKKSIVWLLKIQITKQLAYISYCKYVLYLHKNPIPADLFHIMCINVQIFESFCMWLKLLTVFCCSLTVTMMFIVNKRAFVLKTIIVSIVIDSIKKYLFALSDCRSGQLFYNYFIPFVMIFIGYSIFLYYGSV